MPWYFPWGDSIKKKACRYLLHHYLGSFLQEKLSLDQLSIDIYNGTGTIHDVHVDVQAINQALEDSGVPFQLVDGFAKTITVSIPWSSLITEDTAVEIHGLELTLHPQKRDHEAELDVSWLSQSHMSSSRMLAEECLKDDAASKTLPEGLEAFANTIESVVSRIKISLFDTVIRLENCPSHSSTGIALELRVGRVEYYDEASRDPGTSVDENALPSEPSVFSYKNIRIDKNISIYTDIFSPCHREAYTPEQSMTSSMDPDIFLSAHSAIQSQPVVRPPSYVSSTSRDSLPKECNYINSSPIKFFSCSGEQRLKIKIKNDKGTPGPKLAVDIQLSTIAVYLSPKQAHQIIELVNAFTESMTPSRPGGSGSAGPISLYPSPGSRGITSRSKPMDLQDFTHIENQLQEEKLTVNSPPRALDDYLHHETDSIADSELFQSIGGGAGGRDMMTSSFYSSHSGSTLSKATTGFSTFHNNAPDSGPSWKSPQKPLKRGRFDESKVQSTDIKFELGFLVIVLLNENPISTPADAFESGETETDKLQNKSSRFYDGFACQKTRGILDLSELRRDIQGYCVDNHIMFLAKKIEVKLRQQTQQSPTYRKAETEGQLTVGLCELTEWIGVEERLKTFTNFNLQPTSEILTFTTDEYTDTVESCIRVTFISSDTRSSKQPSSTIDVQFCRPCLLQVDVSITDRLNDLFNPSPVFPQQKQWSNSTAFSSYTNLEASVRSTVPSSSTNLSIRSEGEITVYLRFPIADLRKDPNQKLAWWRRNLRQEILELRLSKPKFETKLSDRKDADVTEFEFVTRSIQGFFYVDAGTPIPFANIGQELDDKEGLEWPRLVVRSYPVMKRCDLEEEEMDSLGSLNGAFSEMGNKDFSPFSNKKAMYNNEELKIPADKKELSDFINQTSGNTQLYIKLTLPSVNIIVPDKHTFELLYNRVCNDLLLWESLAPVPSVHNSSARFHSADLGLNDLSTWANSKYVMCKSILQGASDSEDDADVLGEEMLYSIHNPPRRQQTPQASKSQTFSGQSKACVSIGITKGRLTFANAVKNSKGNPVTSCHGTSALDIQDGLIYVNSKSMGDPHLGYVSVTAGSATLYHNGNIKGPYKHPTHIERLNSSPPANLSVVLELCSLGIPNKLGYTVGAKGDQDMLSIAIRINLDPDPKKYIKYVTVSVALRRGCLHHEMVASPHFWLTQLMESVAVDDYDVLGYPFPKVFTELHLHIIGSAISYVPRNLPYKSLVIFDKFSLSSNVIINSPVSLLRFLIEDASLLLSDRYNRNDINVLRDYVCLLELSHFQLDLKRSDGNNVKYPVIDLSAICAALHIRTCADSLAALQKFITFLAENGDLPEQDTSEDLSDSTLTERDASSDSDTESSHDVPDLMVDAMEDPMTQSVIAGEVERQTYPLEMFEFPGDAGRPLASSSRHLIGQRKPEVSEGDSDSLSDESADFCIVDYPNIPKEGEPAVDYNDRELISVKEDFFTCPKTKVDLLKPPKSFPYPTHRYCLSDLTVVWSMFGGKDFGTGNETTKPPSSQQPGGSHRDLDNFVDLQLSKVRVHCEMYPDNTQQASRYCLLVQDIEIRDRLSVSDVNKLLYQFTSESMPKQLHTSMVSVKAVTLRPDISKPSAQEVDIRVSIQPLRINIDQDALQFFQEFFTKTTADPEPTTLASAPVSFNASNQEVSTPPLGGASKPKSAPADLPVMSVNNPAEGVKLEEGRAIFDELSEDSDEKEKKDQSSASPASTIFIKNFVFTPDVPIRLDYVGKRVDIEQRLQGLLIGLAQLNRSELKLKSLHCKQGILGIDKLLKVCLEEWKRDITRKQLPAIIGGVGPLNSFVQFFQGVQDLVWLPIEQYRKDGRIVRGLQRGANAFSTSTTVAFLELTNRAVQTVQSVAEITYDLVSPTARPRGRSANRHSNPRDFREGVTSALHLVRVGVKDTASNVYNAAAKETEAKGITGAVGGVVRQLPPSILQPVILATDATSQVLSGLRNQLQPDAHREDSEKWKNK